MFRVTAGLPSSAEPLGGWEAPNNELRGHFTGHYLSACALLFAHADDTAMKSRGDTLVAELAKCQAKFGNGYLSAFPEELFDRLRANQPAWAPFYTLHKIMAGMLDMHVLTGNAQARTVLEGMATWTAQWVRPIDTALMERILEREYGGMNEVLYNFAAVSGQDRWRELAQRFDRRRIFEPLAAGRDELQGLHVNTTIPQVIGAARGYELTGDRNLHDCADYFWHTVTERRSLLHRRHEQRRIVERAAGKAGGRAVGLHAGMLRHVQHAEADAPHLRVDRRPARRRLLRARLLQRHPRRAAPARRQQALLRSSCRAASGSCSARRCTISGAAPEAWPKRSRSSATASTSRTTTACTSTCSCPRKSRGRKRACVSYRTRRSRRATGKSHRQGDCTCAAQLRIRVPYWTAGGSVITERRELRELCNARQLLRARSHLARRRPRGSSPADAAARRADAGRPHRAGRDVRTARARRQARHSRAHADNLRAEPTEPRTVPEYNGEPVVAPAIRAASADPATWLRTRRRPCPGISDGRSAENELTLVPLNRVLDERYAVYWKISA